MARKGVFSTDILPKDRVAGDTASERRPGLMPRGAVGALQSSLAQMQEKAVQEIAPDLIDEAGLQDRLGHDPEAHRQLRDSLQEYGQQVPVLLRPHPQQAGRFEIVYGRRRLAALRELGLPVKAMVRQLDDHALVLAQGQENSARADLSFIEKASFAAQLQRAGYDRQTICAALSIDLPMVSRMLKVGTAFSLEFLKKIGSAPTIGRERWLALVRALEAPGAQALAARTVERPGFAALGSDARFEKVLESVSAPRQPPPRQRAAERQISTQSGQVLARVRPSDAGLTITIPAGSARGFDCWVDDNADAILSELHDRWQRQAEEQPNPEQQQEAQTKA